MQDRLASASGFPGQCSEPRGVMVPGGGGDSPVLRASRRAGAELGPPLPNLAHFFQAQNPRCEQDKLEEGVSSPWSPASGWPAPPKRQGVQGGQRRKAQPQRPGSPRLAGYQCMGRGGGGQEDKNSFDKAASLETLPSTWQLFGCAGLGCSRESRAHAWCVWILQLPIIKSK